MQVFVDFIQQSNFSFKNFNTSTKTLQHLNFKTNSIVNKQALLLKNYNF